MAQDDVKISVGIDLAELEKEIDKGSALFQQRLTAQQTSQQTQSAQAPQAQSLKTQEGILKTLSSQFEKLVKTLENFSNTQEKRFEREKATEHQDGGVAGGKRRTTAQVQADEAQERKDREDKEFSRKWGFNGYMIPRGISAVNQFGLGVHAGGGSTSSILSGLGDMAMMGTAFTPWAAPVAGALKTWSVSQADTEKWSDLRANVFREGGESARKALFLSQMAIGKEGMAGGVGEGGLISPYTYGLGAEEQAQLFRGYGKAVGRFESRIENTATGQRTRINNELIDLMKLQGVMGLGTEGISLFGAKERAGASKQSLDVVGAAIGIAMSAQLERGRFGEVFNNLTKMTQSVIHGQADMKALVTGEAFINLLGEQYKGETGAHAAAQQTLQQLASGQGSGLAGYMSLKAAGFGSGRSYFEAKTAQARGLGAVGGISEETIVRTYADMPMYKSMWQSGKKDMAANLIAGATGTNAGVVRDILEGYYGGKMAIAAQAEGIAGKGREAFEYVQPPEYDYKGRRSKFDVEQQGWLKIWGGQAGNINKSFNEGVYDPFTYSDTPSLNFDLGMKAGGWKLEEAGSMLGPVQDQGGSSRQVDQTNATSQSDMLPYESESVLPYGWRMSGTGPGMAGTKQPLTDSETKAVVDSAKRLGIPASRLYAMIFSESKGDPGSVNKRGLGGLIGFSKETAASMGTTVEDLRKLSFEEQMSYVEEFYSKPAAKGKLKSVDDLKIQGFWPLAMSQKSPDTAVMMSASGYSDFEDYYQKKSDIWNKERRGGRTNWTKEDVSKSFYNQNVGEPGLGVIGKGSDRDQSGDITVGEVREHTKLEYERAMKAALRKKQKEETESSITPGTINLLIRVEDARVSITKQASMTKKGIPGQQILIPG